jgi:vacuolar-type H+-ATPase subunit C/Vma6
VIGRAIRYAGPSATVRARFAQLLGADEYRLLLNAPDVAALFAILRTTAYAPALGVAGRSFNFAIQQQWIARTERAARMMPAGARELCLAYMAKVEVEALKTILRGISRSVDRRKLASMLGPLPTTPSIPLTTLLAADNLEQAAHALSGTLYGKVIEEGLKEISIRAPKDASLLILPLETALDREFLARLIAACRHFSGLEGTIVGRLIGTLADCVNILMVERLRKTFHLTPEAASRHLMPFGFRLNGRQRIALCDWNGEGTPPFWFGGGIASRAALRVALLRTLCGEAAKPLFAAPFQAGLTIAYVLLTELESADLVTIYEGKRWGVERGDIAERLIRFSPTGTGIAGV